MNSLATVPVIDQSTVAFLGTSTNTTLIDFVDEPPAPEPIRRQGRQIEEIASVRILFDSALNPSPTRNELNALRSSDLEDGYGRLRPTMRALQQALTLITEAEAIHGILPAGSVSTDSEGGIRITWLVGRHQVQVMFLSDSGDTHLYFEHADDYGMEHHATTASLIEHLIRAGCP